MKARKINPRIISDKIKIGDKYIFMGLNDSSLVNGMIYEISWFIRRINKEIWGYCIQGNGCYVYITNLNDFKKV